MIQLKPGISPSSLNRPRSKAVRTPARPTKKKSKGLRFERVFSDPHVAPFDQVDWERRTAEITDDSGKVIFKQENIEVPKSWSALATKIAVSKYFYGDIANGTDPHKGGRETSVRQLVHRKRPYLILAWRSRDDGLGLEIIGRRKKILDRLQNCHLRNEHAIAVAVEPVSFADGVRVCTHYKFAPAEDGS